jgi:hypothetical protein
VNVFREIATTSPALRLRRPLAAMMRPDDPRAILRLRIDPIALDRLCDAMISGRLRLRTVTTILRLPVP